MSKKHFEALAREIRNTFELDRPWDSLPCATQRAAISAADIICRVASADNARFDAKRFRTACGLFVS